jgi:hypothetical protein
MIVRSQPSFQDIIFTVHGSILPRIARRLAAIAVVSVIAILAAQAHPGIFARISTIPFTLIGIALDLHELPQQCLLCAMVGGAAALGRANYLGPFVRARDIASP